MVIFPTVQQFCVLYKIILKITIQRIFRFHILYLLGLHNLIDTNVDNLLITEFVKKQFSFVPILSNF